MSRRGAPVSRLQRIMLIVPSATDRDKAMQAVASFGERVWSAGLRPPHLPGAHPNLWFLCWSGTVTPDEMVQELQLAGFADPEICLD